MAAARPRIVIVGAGFGGLAAAQRLANRSVDVILVDASTTHPHGFSPFGLAAQEAVVVLSGNSASITEAYSLIKKVSHAFSRKHFRILVNKVRSHPDARSIYENIAQVAAQRGIARLDYELRATDQNLKAVNEQLNALDAALEKSTFIVPR